MGYAHIENLYRPDAQKILCFRQCYALEKVHGTSAHITYQDGKITLFAGGVAADSFAALFDLPELTRLFEANGVNDVTVYGEAYGGKCQGMRAVYGPKLRFIAFDVRIGDLWVSVPAADAFVKSLGLRFVPYEYVSTDLATLDQQRDRESVVAQMNAAEDGATYDTTKREGVVLRPPFEVRTNNGERICAKHKRAEFCERVSTPSMDPDKLTVLKQAEAIADEWVTEMRLTHVLDRLGNPNDPSAIPSIIATMIEDVTREASGEIIDSKEARKAIGNHTVKLFKARLTKITPNID